MPNKDSPNEEVPKKELTYVEKAWYTMAIFAFLVVVILIIRVAFNVLLMALAGSLIAVYFHGLGDIIERNTKLGRRSSMIFSIVGSLFILGVLTWFMGTKIQDQITALSNSLPQTITTAKEKLQQTPAGQKILEYLSGNHSDKLFATVQQFFSTSFGVLGDLYIILFLGIFFTASPALYKNGILKLIPSTNKPLARKILDRSSQILKGWLKGMMISMVLITILLPIGLNIMHVPVALVLGIITGILVIVPNFGSFAAMIPGVLLALTISTNTAILVALIYIGIQTLVGNIIAPLVQKKMMSLPPALTILGQLVMGSVAGVMGIIMAVPLLALVMILVDELYVKKIN